MSLEEHLEEKLWSILVETVHAMVMFPKHKAYTRETIIPENQGIKPEMLAARLHIPLGEALVILYELSKERNSQAMNTLSSDSALI